MDDFLEFFDNPYVEGFLTLGKCIAAVGVCFVTYKLAGAYAWEAGWQAKEIFSRIGEDVGDGVKLIAEKLADGAEEAAA